MEDISWRIVEQLEARSKEYLEYHITPWEDSEIILPKEDVTEETKSEVKDYSMAEEFNESANILNKYLVSGHPSI